MNESSTQMAGNVINKQGEMKLRLEQEGFSWVYWLIISNNL